MVLGMAAVSALMIAGVQQTLPPRLLAQGLSVLEVDKVCQFRVPICSNLLILSTQIVKRAVTDVNYLDETPSLVSKAIVASYVDGLEYSHGMPLLCTVKQSQPFLMNYLSILCHLVYLGIFRGAAAARAQVDQLASSPPLPGALRRVQPEESTAHCL